MVKGPIYLGPNFLLGMCSFINFVERYTLSPTLNGGVSLLLLFACCLYAMDALVSASLICGQILLILSVHSVGVFGV